MTTRLLLSLLILLMSARPTHAWSTEGHRLIMDRAIDLLPAELRPFFEHYRQELVLRVVDPDTWRTAGWEDDPNHFVNFGVSEYGAFPFTALPREYGAALEKFGMETLRKNGLLPWRTAEEFGNLRRAFEGFSRHSPYAPADVVLFAGIASHYIEDATMPLHASNNYDGQLTGQRGLHARFETVLFDRYHAQFALTPGPAVAMRNPRDTAFDLLLASYQSVPVVLAADTQAAAGRETYDDEYFARLFAQTRTVLERQFSSAITATASLIIGAWEAAGKPQLMLDVPTLPRRVHEP